jgi:hypothetical protein
MPCHPARARELVRSGRAIRRFNRGMFYIKLLDRTDLDVQPVAVGVDPGSKWEGYSVVSEKHVFVNIQANAVDWVKDAIEVRRNMRRARRFRKTPCRKNRSNRLCNTKRLPPSTKARWQWKLRLCTWLSRLYPIETFVVEDIAAVTKQGKRRWNASFSPLQVGKEWLSDQLGKLGKVVLVKGYVTAELRSAFGLEKTKKKSLELFEAHAVDAFVIARNWVGGDTRPENKRLTLITPLRFHRRQLHKLQPSIGGVRKREGGTISHGFKRGSLVKHVKYGLTYVGGYLKDRISLHCVDTGKRLCQNAKPCDVQFLTFNTWRLRVSSPA